jgi:hypothetical protein
VYPLTAGVIVLPPSLDPESNVYSWPDAVKGKRILIRFPVIELKL